MIVIVTDKVTPQNKEKLESAARCLFIATTKAVEALNNTRAEESTKPLLDGLKKFSKPISVALNIMTGACADLSVTDCKISVSYADFLLLDAFRAMCNGISWTLPENMICKEDEDLNISNDDVTALIEQDNHRISILSVVCRLRDYVLTLLLAAKACITEQFVDEAVNMCVAEAEQAILYAANALRIDPRHLFNLANAKQ